MPTGPGSKLKSSCMKVGMPLTCTKTMAPEYCKIYHFGPCRAHQDHPSFQKEAPTNLLSMASGVGAPEKKLWSQKCQMISTQNQSDKNMQTQVGDKMFFQSCGQESSLGLLLLVITLETFGIAISAAEDDFKLVAQFFPAGRNNRKKFGL